MDWSGITGYDKHDVNFELVAFDTAYLGLVLECSREFVQRVIDNAVYTEQNGTWNSLSDSFQGFNDFLQKASDVTCQARLFTPDEAELWIQITTEDSDDTRRLCLNAEDSQALCRVMDNVLQEQSGLSLSEGYQRCMEDFEAVYGEYGLQNQFVQAEEKKHEKRKDAPER